MEITKRKLLQSMLVAPMLAAPALILTGADKADAQSATPAMAPSGPGYSRFRVGDIEVIALLDGYMQLPTQFIIGYDEAVARQSTQASYRRFTEGAIPISVNAYVIKTGSEVILVDAGAPKFMAPDVGRLAANMKSAGIDPSEITNVMMTHLAVDHVNALINQDGSKVFENAGIIASETEWGFLHNPAVREATPEQFRGMIDFGIMAVAAYSDQRQLFNGETDLASGISSLPLPGHTPGHSGYVVRSQDESLLIWGDLVHFNTLQFANPDWGIVFDVDAAQAAETRKRTFDRVSADRMAVAGMHVDFPGVGYVERSGDGYRYITAPNMPI
jgi:glyoxylase-like metal-dependent hydrolase (beta-lactamase superfamily II)